MRVYDSFRLSGCVNALTRQLSFDIRLLLLLAFLDLVQQEKNDSKEQDHNCNTSTYTGFCCGAETRRCIYDVRQRRSAGGGSD